MQRHSETVERPSIALNFWAFRIQVAQRLRHCHPTTSDMTGVQRAFESLPALNFSAGTDLKLHPHDPISQYPRFCERRYSIEEAKPFVIVHDLAATSAAALSQALRTECCAAPFLPNSKGGTA